MSPRTIVRPSYAGRHRAPEPVSTGGISLPGAAAAALTITATGAAVIPGLGAGSAAATDSHPTVDRVRAAQSAAPGDTAATTLLAARSDFTDTGQIRRAEMDAMAERAKIRASREKQRQDLAEEKAREQRWVAPLKGFRFSSPFGSRWGRLHAGDDLAAPVGTRIGSLSSGTVIFAGQQSGYGNKVEVRHWDGTVSCYGHMSRITVKVGDDVAPGDHLGDVGNTGRSTGPHLHLEIHPNGGDAVNPRPWLAERGIEI